MADAAAECDRTFKACSHRRGSCNFTMHDLTMFTETNQQPRHLTARSRTPLLRPFRGLRPAPGRAPDVIAPPYDVITTDEARARSAGKPWSFLHISRAEIGFPDGTDPCSQ